MGILDTLAANASNEIDKMTQKTNNMVKNNREAERHNTPAARAGKDIQPARR